MQLAVVVGKPLRIIGDMIIVQEGDTVSSYNPKYYRLADEPSQPELDKPIEMVFVGNFHAIAVPVYQ